METIAIYWEPVIKTYGFLERTALLLLSLRVRMGGAAGSVSRLLESTSPADRFLMVMGQIRDGESLCIHLLCDPADDGARPPFLDRIPEDLLDGPPRLTRPVDMICFHGPHFGDRYGIADAAFGALIESGLPILASACTAASITIVLPENTARTAVLLLSPYFEDPRVSRRRS